MRRISTLALLFVAVFTITWLGVAFAAPADVLHDPLANPAAAIDDIAQAERQGWTVAILAGATIAARLLGALGKRFPKVSWLAILSRGRVALVVGASAAVLAACYNAAALGGSWMSILTAGIVAGAAWANLRAADPEPSVPEKAPASSEPST